LALASQTRKSKENIGGESTLQARKKRESRKGKGFACHKSGHYASRCFERKKGKINTQQVAVSTKTQVKDFVERLKNDLLLVSCLSGTISDSV
jgi:hypothetical protein